MSEPTTKFSGPHESAFDAFEHPGEAANLKVRATLMSCLDDYIREHDLKQVAAAKEFGVDQSRVSQLVNGRISQFTIDALINMCSHAGINVNVTFDGVRADDDR